jgi:hypothetical protein
MGPFLFRDQETKDDRDRRCAALGQRLRGPAGSRLRRRHRGKPVRIVNVRARRPNPGLRHQHVRAIQAICQLVGGSAQGAVPGARSVSF